jgi:hypothetical protein
MWQRQLCLRQPSAVLNNLSLSFLGTRLAKRFTGPVKTAVVHKVSHQRHRVFKSGHDITSWLTGLADVSDQICRFILWNPGKITIRVDWPLDDRFKLP